MKKLISVFFLFFTFVYTMVAAPPVPFSGKLAVDGKNFHGNALFAFSIVDGEGKIHWNHSEKPGTTIENFVVNGRYLVLLGGQGMQPLPANLFLENDNLFLRVRVNLQDGQGIRLLEPDQPITSTPYALAAELARLAEKASLADGVTPGAITAGMIDTSLLADLNRTGSITEITREMLPQDVRDDINRTITKSMLSQEVLNELNSSSGGGGVVPGSLLAVLRSQSAPSGYSLYEEGEPKELVWEEKATVRVPRIAFNGGSVLDGKIYFLGGVFDGVAQDVCERYDPESDSWEDIASLITPRNRIASAVVNGKIYAIGGLDSISLASVEMLDPTANSWEETASLPVAIHDSSAISLNNKIYLVGGRNDSGVLGSVYCFDPSNSTWEEKASLSVPRFSARLAFFMDRIWAIGGYANGQESSLVESYSLETDSWQIEPSLIIPRNLLTVWSTSKSIYALGGIRNSLGSAKLSSLERFDYLAENWVLDGSFIEPAAALSSVVDKNKAYVFGGDFESGVSSALFAADLNASVSGVFDLYRKDGNASSGVPTVQAEVADGSVTASKMASNTITTNQLSEQILKYLKPEVTTQPQVQTVFADTNHTLSVSAEGKYLTYQWKKNGTALAGETNATLTITDTNATQHDGNYSVVVSNDFGSVESGEFEIQISDVLMNGLIGWWKFDETSGTVAYDASGYGHDANLTNGPTWVTGKIGGALSFDGNDDLLKLPHQMMNGLGDFSISFWFKENETKEHFFLSLATEVEFNSFIFYVSTNNTNIRILEKDQSVINYESNANFEQWKAISLVRTSSDAKIFLSGSLLHQVSYNGGSIEVAENGLWIGGEQDALGGGWSTAQQTHGLLDDYRIYNRALSTEEIQVLYQLGQ